MNITLRQLKAFLSVAEEGNFTKAAHRLHMSQAALSASIRELESQLSCRLFQRTSRRVEITGEGKEFYRAAADVVDTLDRVASSLVAKHKQSSGIIRIGVTPTSARTVLPIVLTRFRRSYPGVEVHISDGSPQELQRMVEEGTLDAAFGAYWRKIAGIKRERIFESYLLAVTPVQDANTAMVDASKQSSWESLRGATLICLPTDSPVQRLVNRQLAAVNCVPTEKTQVNQIETAVMMAEAGFGVAVVPSFAASICKKYSVEATMLQPLVECSFYFIVRAGQEVVEQLGFFSHEFAEVLAELAATPGTLDMSVEQP
jgi:DNA-binding transcriptional LysR family regulator